jgi:conjugal transfer pilus assembly protein TraK
MALEQLGQHGQDIIALELALDMDRQALAAVLVDHGKHAEGLARVSFFATSKAGYVYKFACRLGGEEATQLFITNPALAKAAATEWETETGPEDAAIRLIEAMASDAVLPGFTARAELSAPRRTGGIEVQLVAEYQGDELTGQRFLVRNLGQESLALGSEREGAAGALAFAYGRDALAPGEATSAFLVFAKGGLD